MTAGLLDTSVVIDWHDPDVASQLPDELAVSAITVAELSAGPHLAGSAVEASRRQSRLQEVVGNFDPLPFDSSAASSYGLAVGSVVTVGRQPRRRLADLLIAATAHANGLDLYTRNADDFVGLEELVRIVAL